MYRYKKINVATQTGLTYFWFTVATAATGLFIYQAAVGGAFIVFLIVAALQVLRLRAARMPALSA